MIPFIFKHEPEEGFDQYTMFLSVRNSSEFRSVFSTPSSVKCNIIIVYRRQPRPGYCI